MLSLGLNIHQASESGDFERFKELINEVPELKNKPDERGWTPLHIVTAFGHLEILKWLTVNGVNLTEETPTGFTAIHLAAMNGHVKCIMVRLECSYRIIVNHPSVAKCGFLQGLTLDR